jgi:hypothetical protein
MSLITVPNPLPPPIPGGGPRTGYQWRFNQRYYAKRKPALQPFSYGLAAAFFPNRKALTQDELTALADKLYDWVAPGGPGVYGKKHVDFDEEIDYWQWDPYAVSYQRSQLYGYQRVPIGTGNTVQPPEIVNPADLQGPPIPGKYLLVTCDINLL